MLQVNIRECPQNLENGVNTEAEKVKYTERYSLQSRQSRPNMDEGKEIAGEPFSSRPLSCDWQLHWGSQHCFDVNRNKTE